MIDITPRGKKCEAIDGILKEGDSVAEDYADALGERIVRVVSISDAPETPSFGGPQARFAAASAGGSAEVTVAEITVSASVQGVFESE